MGPKKGKKGKKSKKGGGLGEDVEPEERNYILQAEVESLRIMLVQTTEEANHAKACELEKRVREKQMKALEDEERKRTEFIVGDMTRQYKATFEDLNF